MLYPDVPGRAFDEFMDSHAHEASHRVPWSPEQGPMPALYLSHGAPPLFDDPTWIAELHTWAQSMPVPRGVLIVSAHWEAAPISLSSPSAATPLVYDFGGFAQRYFSMKYETPDASQMATSVRSLLSGEVHDQRRGLDHGAWVPLKIMYPYADVPVLQLSLPTQDPMTLVRIGNRLRALREEGVLVIGSGFMTHGLPYMTSEMWLDNAVPGWSSEFDAWADQAVARMDIDELADYRAKGPGSRYAHPTVEHFTPLFVAMGAAGEQPPSSAVSGFQFGLSKRSFQFDG